MKVVDGLINAKNPKPPDVGGFSARTPTGEKLETH
jgi:hypothetical protein